MDRMSFVWLQVPNQATDGMHSVTETVVYGNPWNRRRPCTLTENQSPLGAWSNRTVRIPNTEQGRIPTMAVF